MRRPSSFSGFLGLSLMVWAVGCSSGDDGSNPEDDGGTDGSSSTDTADGGGGADTHVPSDDVGADGASDTNVPPADTADAGPTDATKPTRPGACSPAIESPTPDVQTARPKGTTCAALGYYEYVPAGYASGSNWPLIIAFHGDGERGNGDATQIKLLLNNGLTADIPKNKWDPKKRFVVLAPQMDDRGGLTERTAGSVDAFVKFAKANYDIDVKRIYLTGLSGGGAPVYNYLGTYSGGEVAATNINAGWYSTQGKECLWKDIPTWYFHSDKDGTVPAPDHSTKSYDTLMACSPAAKTAPRYTMYKGLGHSAWGPTYDLTGMDATKYPLIAPGTTPYDPSLYDWFLTHTR